MTLKLLPTTLAGPLWARAPVRPKQNGCILEAEMAGAQYRATCFAPMDPTRLCVTDDSGAIFLFSIKKNKFVVVARLSSGPVVSVAFTGEHHIVAASGMSLALVNFDTSRVEASAREGHNNHIFAVAVPADAVAGVSYSAAAISTDTVSLWATLPALRLRHAKRSQTALSAVQLIRAHVFTVEVAGFVTKYDMDLQTVARIDVRGHSPTSLSAYNTYLVAGCRGGSVLCLNSDLEGISSVAIPSSTAVVSTAIIEGDVFAAHCSDGTTWFVVAQNYGVSFSMSHPSPQPTVAFALGGATYAVFATKQRLFLYHLPTAKLHFERLLGGLSPALSAGKATMGLSATGGAPGSTVHSSSSMLSSAVPFVQGPRDRSAPVSSEAAESSSVVIRKSVLAVPDPDDKDRAWVKVNLINSMENQTGPGISKPLPLRNAVRGLHDEVCARNSGIEASRDAGKVNATTSKVSQKKKPRAAASQGHPTADASLDEHCAGEVSLRSLLDHDSRVINMDKIRSMLMRYGVFPDRYRHLIWRFLLHLPDKRLAAPHFANLASKGPHPSTAVLTKPFPLPENRLRIVFQKTLSALAWHAPAFSVAHFMPNIAFPFVKVFGADIQSSIEIVVSFFLNWGREFLTYYPHPPVSLISFMSHMLKLEDAALAQHLEDRGIGSDVWAWIPMSSVYTDILTRNEWLQVMDHAFANEPLWLFLFHLSWLHHIRVPLLQLSDGDTLVSMFHKCTPCNINHVIREAYRLHNRALRSELTEPYETLVTFDETCYPAHFEYNEGTITTKIQELEKLQRHEEDFVASNARISQVRQQLVQSAMLEDAFVGRQRALVAAKFDVENETWTQQVQLERERQRLRDVEHEVRLKAIQEQLRSAQRLEALNQEMQAAQAHARDANVDRERELMKWDFADRMAAHEVGRLEQGARMKLTTMMVATSADELQLQQQTGTAMSPPHRDEPSFASGAAEQTEGNSRENDRSAATGDAGIAVATAPTAAAATAAAAAVRPPPPRPQLKASDLDEDRNDIKSAGSSEPRAASHRGAPQPQPRATDGKHRFYDPVDGHPTPPSAAAVATQTELPPPAPRSGSTPSSTGGSAMRFGAPMAATSTTATTPSAPSSSCEDDPIGYYQRVQREIQSRVERAQEEQRRALAQLRSRYARTLTADEEDTETATVNSAEDSTVTEPECAGSSSSSSGSSVDGRRASRLDTVSDGREDHHHHHHFVSDHDDGASTIDSSSITQALLRPHNPAVYDLRRRTTTESSSADETTTTTTTGASVPPRGR